jgi:hypothetical protein
MKPMNERSYADIYRHYLAKFEELFGTLDFGDVAQHRGQLIQKLSYNDFVAKWQEFKQLDDYLCEVMSKGATLNDDIHRNYLALSAHVLETPKDYMTM